MKISKYLVSQNFYDNVQNAEKVILFSTISGSVRVILASVWNAIQKNDFSFLQIEYINDLIKNFFILEDNIDELSMILSQNLEYKKEISEYYCVIQPSASCQFGCHYCGQSHSSDKLTNVNQRLIVERTINKLKDNKYKGCSIGWFGAEPLTGMKSIKEISKELIDFCFKNDLTYSAKIVTNGLLLKRNIAISLFEECKINLFEITLDGIANFHDERRHTKNGDKTFDIIYNNILAICSDKPNDLIINIRCNIDNRNNEGVIPLLDRLKADGLEKKINIYFAPLHSWGNDAHKLAAEKNEFSEWEIKWYIHMIKLGFTVPLIPARVKNLCMAVNSHSELIDPFGSVFSCSEVSLVPNYEKNGVNKYSLGTLSEGISDEKRKIFSDFYQEGVLNSFPCYNCSILPICGGGCPKSWKEQIPACPSKKFNISKRILLHYAQLKMLEQDSSLVV